MLDTAKMEEIIRKSGYKKGFVAEKLGITQQALTDILNGRRKMYAMEYFTFCQFFKIEPQEIITVA